MNVRDRFVCLTLLILPLAGGCNSRFAGEWLQQSVADRTGEMKPVGGERRMALQFIPPSTVRVGSYSNASRTVEVDSVTSDDYQTIQDRSIAQFGNYTARVEDGHLVTYIAGKVSGKFEKLKGKSVFPPMVGLPSLVRSHDSAESESAIATAE